MGVEVRGSRVLGHLQLHVELEASLDYMSSCFPKREKGDERKDVLIRSTLDGSLTLVLSAVPLAFPVIEGACSSGKTQPCSTIPTITVILLLSSETGSH